MHDFVGQYRTSYYPWLEHKFFLALTASHVLGSSHFPHVSDERHDLGVQMSDGALGCVAFFEWDISEPSILAEGSLRSMSFSAVCSSLIADPCGSSRYG